MTTLRIDECAVIIKRAKEIVAGFTFDYTLAAVLPIVLRDAAEYEEMGDLSDTDLEILENLYHSP